MEQMLNQFKKEKPREKLLILNKRNKKYAGDYVSFNLDILRRILPRTTLDFVFSGDEVRIKGDKSLARKFLFDLQTLCAFDEQSSEVILIPYVVATEIMSLACKLLKNFEKSLDQNDV